MTPWWFIHNLNVYGIKTDPATAAQTNRLFAILYGSLFAVIFICFVITYLVTK